MGSLHGFDLFRMKVDHHLFGSQPLDRNFLYPSQPVTGGSVPNRLHEHCDGGSKDSTIQGSSPLLPPDKEYSEDKTSAPIDTCVLPWNNKPKSDISGYHNTSEDHPGSRLQTLKQDASCGSYISLPGADVTSSVAKSKDVKSSHPLFCTADSAFKTTVMYISFFALGLVNGILGPTLMELQTIASTTTTNSALLFTWGAVGRIPGSLGTAAIVDRYSPPLLLGVAVMLLATSTCLLPWCVKYSVMAVVIVIQGVGIGSLGSGCTAYCFQLWTSRAAPFVQALGFIMALGNTCAPLLAKPFLTQALLLSAEHLNISQEPPIHTTPGSLLGPNPEMSLLSHPNASNFAFRASAFNQEIDLETRKEDPYGDISRDLINDTMSSRLLISDVPTIAPPYLIISSLHLLASLLYLIVYVQNRGRSLKHQQSKSSSSSSSTQGMLDISVHSVPSQAQPQSKLLCVLFGLFMFCCAGLEVTYGGLLLTFMVEYLRWTKSMAAYLTFAYWMCVASGRGIGVIFVKFISPRTIVIIDIIGACVSLVLLASCLDKHVIFLWVCTCILGLSISTLVAATLNLAYRYLQLTGRLTAIFMCCNYAGIMVLPGVTGALFREVSGQAFIYCQVVTVAVMIVVFIAIQLYYLRWNQKFTSLEQKESNNNVNI